MEVTDKEIKHNFFHPGDDKAHDPDQQMFWNFVGQDICKAIKEFFKQEMQHS